MCYKRILYLFPGYRFTVTDLMLLAATKQKFQVLYSVNFEKYKINFRNTRNFTLPFIFVPDLHKLINRHVMQEVIH